MKIVTVVINYLPEPQALDSLILKEKTKSYAFFHF